jgi:hypothetical protein
MPLPFYRLPAGGRRINHVHFSWITNVSETVLLKNRSTHLSKVIQGLNDFHSWLEWLS